MNNILLQGSLHSEPELRYAQDGTARLSVLLVFPAARTDEPDPTIRVVLFGTDAQQWHGQLKQGDPVIVEGRLQVESRPRPDGSRERTIELIARQFYPLAAGAAPEPAPPAPLPSARAAADRLRRRPPATATSRPLAVVGADDDIPF